MSFLLETRNWDIIAPSMLWILRFLRHFRCFEKLQGQQNSNIYCINIPTVIAAVEPRKVRLFDFIKENIYLYNYLPGYLIIKR